MFIDSSAILGVLLDEQDASGLSARIEAATTPLMTSPIVVLEAALNLSRIKAMPLSAAHEFVAEFLDTLAITNIPITPEIGGHAVRAYARFGKGSGHPARLNLADAFSYACAEFHEVPLLNKGDDFASTDLG